LAEKIWSEKGNPDRRVSEKLGIQRYELGGAGHTIKQRAGLRGADLVDIYSDGTVTDQATGEVIGNVYDEL